MKTPATRMLMVETPDTLLVCYTSKKAPGTSFAQYRCPSSALLSLLTLRLFHNFIFHCSQSYKVLHSLNKHFLRSSRGLLPLKRFSSHPTTCNSAQLASKRQNYISTFPLNLAPVYFLPVCLIFPSLLLSELCFKRKPIKSSG